MYFKVLLIYSFIISSQEVTDMFIQNKRLVILLISAALLMLLPFIAMQFSNEVNWSIFDFMVMGSLLFGTGLISELVLRKINKKRHRIILFLAIAAMFLLIWAELAVGILGTSFAGS